MTRLVAAVALLGLVSISCGGSGSAAFGPEPAATVAQVLGRICNRDRVGSGVLIAHDLVLTSAHVLAGSEGDLSLRRPGEAALPATLVGFDPNRDLALLAAPGIGGDVATLATADRQTEGVIGTVTNEGILELLPFEVDRLVTANSGDIYDENEVTRAALQLNAATLPGDSGGALFDSANRVVGVVFAQSRQTDNVAYAVASAEIEAFLDSVDSTSEVAAGRCR